MKKNTLVLFLLLSSTIYAQEVVSTQGDSYYTGSGSMDFTIGEPVISTESDGSNDITQGFHQTNWNFVSLEDLAPEMEVQIYPNPASDVLIISTKQFEGVSFWLTDVNGKTVKRDALLSESTTLDVHELAPGKYSVVLFNQNQNKLKTINLIKNQ